MLVLYTAQVYRRIKQGFEANFHREIGGLLVGYRFFHAFIVVGATMAVSKEPLSQVSFELDGHAHSAQAERIIETSTIRPAIVGIWHSHLCDTNRFSIQDKNSNQVMAHNLHGTLSALVTAKVSGDGISLSTFYVPINGNEQICTAVHL